MRYTFQDLETVNKIGEGYSAYTSPFIFFVDF